MMRSLLPLLALHGMPLPTAHKMKEGVIRLDMDIKVIEQLVEQALKEIKAEQPLKFTAPKLERQFWCV